MKKLKYWIVSLIINNGLRTNKGEFRKGDRVKYNWKAKVFIPEEIDEDTRVVADVISMGDSDNIKFTDKDHSDAFWLRRVKKGDKSW